MYDYDLTRRYMDWLYDFCSGDKPVSIVDLIILGDYLGRDVDFDIANTVMVLSKAETIQSKEVCE